MFPQLNPMYHSRVKKIFGPPGTGKTTFLLNIVEQELESELTPEDIAFVAYTKKAASEAINRAAYKFKLDQINIDNLVFSNMPSPEGWADVIKKALDKLNYNV